MAFSLSPKWAFPPKPQMAIYLNTSDCFISNSPNTICISNLKSVARCRRSLLSWDGLQGKLQEVMTLILPRKAFWVEGCGGGLCVLQAREGLQFLRIK